MKVGRYALTLADVRKLDPCAPALERVAGLLPKRGKVDAAKARALGCTYDDIIWAASAVAVNDKVLARRLTSFGNDNAKAVLHIWEQRFPDDARPRKAIEACDAFLNGKVTEGDWREADWAARADWADWAVWAALDALDARAAWAASVAFRKWQFDRLVYVLTADNPKPLPMPEVGKPLPEIAALIARAEGGAA